MISKNELKPFGDKSVVVLPFDQQKILGDQSGKAPHLWHEQIEGVWGIYVTRVEPQQDKSRHFITTKVME